MSSSIGQVPAHGTSELLGTLFDHLDASGVVWALLRGRDALDVPGGDVDLLVRADDLASFEDVVFELGAYMLPRVRVPGAWSRAVLRPSWHRFYVLSDGSGAPVKLDVVTQLVYGRRHALQSTLEQGCLERRVQDRGVYVLDPTDTFWTVLLHCLLDKGKVTAHRAAGLEAVVADVRRPSPGEEFFTSLGPPGCSADQALSAVRAADWQALAELGAQIRQSHGDSRAASSQAAPADEPESAAERKPRRRIGVRTRVDRAVRAAAVATYPALWRRAGLGAVPRALDVAETAALDATVLRLRRRPGLCDVLLLVEDERGTTLAEELRSEHYVATAGRWHRITGTGLERVRLVTAAQLGLSAEEARRLRDSAAPMAGRDHCRRARTSITSDGGAPCP